MQRFFVDTGLKAEQTVMFSQVQQHQISHVLRLGAGEKVELFDGRTDQVFAAEQSKQARIPQIAAPSTYRAVLEGEMSPWLIAVPGAKRSLAESLLQGSITSEVGILIGPEGGWTAEELALAEAKNIPFVGLGPTILRTETASIVVAALVLALASTRNID